ncbi:PAS domain-containing protein [Asanoa iriomotensis]|uniref:protein-glutamate O-methyltransferase n=2 Tax=Asanoa iriomotensis TaxID=234613 RepID=A0ABQ4BXL9_9ACTN|nr:chemotaxis protein CheR [Asanoa iriomotensis]
MSAEIREPGLDELLIFIRDARGFDFTGYKRSSVARRISKRMNDIAVANYVDYRDVLETDAAEFSALFNTILINVTSFFRDPDCWAEVREQIIPELLEARPDGQIRVWSAGCSTGEEPYTLAILFAEILGEDEFANRVKIYGTDVDEDALREARSGTYPATSLAPVPADLRERYFASDGEQYTVNNDLRGRVIFGRHDITRDAPISRLDMLVCRNTLMYFNVETQKQIIDRYHFALRDGGYLFLGKAEMLLTDSNRFEVANLRRRLFRRRAGDTAQTPPALPPIQTPIQSELREVARRRRLRDLTIEAAPNAVVLVDVDGTVSMFNDLARDMFGLAATDLNRPFQDLELSHQPVDLRPMIEQAEAERRHLRVTAAERHLTNGSVEYIDVLLQPLFDDDKRKVGTALTFVDTTTASKLQNELQRTRQDLQKAYESLQSTNEELQASIEELETTNEELQSTNEELETTNEELESGNEELETMNEELRIRRGELDEARTFLSGVLSSIVAGVVVLDSQLRVRSWNRGAEELWGLRSHEVSQQPFFSLDFGLAVSHLRAIVEQCRTSRQRTGPVELAAVNRIGRKITCSVACSPLDDHGEGVVLLMEQLHRS